MTLHCLGSSSSGNLYIFEAEDSALLVEAGIKFDKVVKALDFNTNKICGCVISHSHSDHSGRAVEFASKGIDIYTSKETIDEIKNTDRYIYRFNAIESGKLGTIGPWTIKPFDLIHDVKCFGYMIKHDEMGLAVFVTDTQYAVQKFPGVNHLIVEANYSGDIMDRNITSGRLSLMLGDRVAKSHMSLETAKELIKINNSPSLQTVVLTHLSDGNSNEREFKRQVEEYVGRPCYVADYGMKIEIGKTPF